MGADVVIIGGGPVGCWTAIQIKSRNPALAVQIYERHQDYQRDHMMSIRRGSFMNFSKRTGDPLETALFKKIAAAHNAPQGQTPAAGLPNVTHIRTLDLERILKEHCEACGVNITYEKVETPQEVMARHPECSIFIAADGAHSKMRTALLGEDSLYKRDINPSVDVKYKVKGSTDYMREPTYDKIDTIVVETVGKEEDGTSTVALRFLVDPATYDSLPAATFKNPLSVAETGPFQNKIRQFQDLRAAFTGEERIPDSEVVTKIKLSQYASKKFAVTVDNNNRKAGWFVIGDAAMGLPFYRSINAGLKMGAQLGAVIGTSTLSNRMKVGVYNNIVRPASLAQEFGIVAAKQSGLALYQKAVRPSLRMAARIGLGAVVLPLAALFLLLNRRGRMM